MIPERRHSLRVSPRSVRWIAIGAGWDIRNAWLLFLAALVLALAPAVVFAADQSSQAKPYALIFGTVYGPDNRPLYGVLVKVRRADKKKAQWELMSDHQGEFAQRVPPGPADYIVWTDEKLSKILKAAKGEDKANKKQVDPASGGAGAAGAPSGREVKVHIENDERVDVGLHLMI